ncbi:hypothetical protein MycrhDRAFT_2776 [Mycolicibacterium rhodesiae JS60]|nr:hypothetical protein MycrhDRAFT_2776 [Mycolicibacterium rhodesiae JS60]
MNNGADWAIASRAHERAVQFAEAANARDGAAVAELFSDDGVWELPGMAPVIGRRAIAEAFTTVIDGFDDLVQIVHPGLVSVGPDGVTARHYVTEFATRPSGSFLQAAVYDDILNPDAGWGFSSRKLRLLSKFPISSAARNQLNRADSEGHRGV